LKAHPVADNSSKQVEVMKKLTQASAAWLAGISPRSLRDAADLVRAPNGTYSGRDVVAWCAKRVPLPKLDDNELEKILVLTDQISCDEQAIDAMLRTIDELKAVHGEHVLMILFGAVVDRWREQARLFRELETDEETRRQAEELHRKSRADESAKKSLRIVTVCETCKKIRTGKQWKKGEPPPGFAVTYDLCPECER
jgi:hypothetical protein